MNVLLVEDSPSDQLLTQQMFRGTSWKVEVATSVRRAIELLQEGSFAAILLDLSLPDSDRLSGLVNICAAAPAIPIVVLTGLEDEGIASQAIQAGAQDYLVKGTITPSLLVRSIRYSVDRQRQSEAMKELSESRRAMVELLGASDGVFDWRIGSERVEFAPGFRRILGFAGDDRVGLPDTLSRFRALTHPDDVKGFWQAAEHCLATQKPVEHEFRLRCRDDNYAWVRCRANAIIDDLGEPQRMVGTIYDITERKRIEKDAQSLLERYERVVDGSGAALWDLDLVSDEIHYSARWNLMRGFDAGRPTGGRQGWQNSIHPEDRSYAASALEAHIAGETAEFETIYRCHTQNGDWIYVHDHGKSYRDSDGQVIRVSGTKIDRTAELVAKKLLEEQNKELERATTDLRQFVDVASHDLQEPLRAVGSFLQLLETRLGDQLDEKSRHYLTNSVQGAARMQRLIEDLLHYSKVTHSNAAFAKVSMTEVINEAQLAVQFSIRESGAQFEVGDLPSIVGNRLLLIQLFQNLFGNAIKYRSDQTPLIQVAAQRDGAFWKFTVRDNGIGIPSEYRSKIFAIFSRLHRREEHEGTGIGLAICKRVVERHGGRIEVEPGEPEVGSCFIVRLPLQAEPASNVVPDPKGNQLENRSQDNRERHSAEGHSESL